MIQVLYKATAIADFKMPTSEEKLHTFGDELDAHMTR